MCAGGALDLPKDGQAGCVARGSSNQSCAAVEFVVCSVIILGHSRRNVAGVFLL